GIDNAVALARQARPAEVFLCLVAADPAIAIPECLAVTQPQAVDHAVADKPVVGGRVWWRQRVRTDARQQAVEFARNLALDRKFVAAAFHAHRGVRPFQERIAAAHRNAFLSLFSEPANGAGECGCGHRLSLPALSSTDDDGVGLMVKAVCYGVNDIQVPGRMHEDL